MFKPKYKFSKKIISSLMKIEAVKGQFEFLPVTPRLLATLRKSARLLSTHYSTKIEGNRLSQEEVNSVVGGGKAEKGKKRDEAEVKGYYAALDELEKIVGQGTPITELEIQKLHAMVMGSGKKRIKPAPYRRVQNVIKESLSGRIVYLPPEPKDVPVLMIDLLKWLAEAEKDEVPCPVQAAVAHYQFATIHPYIDGNGRMARLLATLVLRLGGYGLKGIYSLDEYYAKDLRGYYKAISVGPSHNYYMGREKADITHWIEYFTTGMAISFETVKGRAEAEAKGAGADKSRMIRQLNARQRELLGLFEESNFITAKDVSGLFGVKDRMARILCKEYVEKGFLTVVDSSKKGRRYALSKKWTGVVKGQNDRGK